MILMDAEFQGLPWFQGLPRFERITFDGTQDSGAGLYRVERDTSIRNWLITVETIYKEDKMLWEAYKELFAFALKTAEASLFGNFEYRLLALGDLEKMSSFKPENLAQYLVNYCRNLGNGESRLVSYAHSRGILKKLTPGDWGKIRFSHGVAVHNQERGKLDLFVKKLLQDAADFEGRGWLVIRDLGRQPIFRFGEEPQTERLGKYLEKNKEFLAEKINGIYFNHKTSVIDLITQFGLEIPSRNDSFAPDTQAHP